LTVLTMGVITQLEQRNREVEKQLTRNLLLRPNAHKEPQGFRL